MQRSQALWYTDENTVEVRGVEVPAPGPDQVLVRALYSGLSRGTERLVLQGRVPASEYARMRCPYQEGDFPFPVKYGYALVGVIEGGPRAGETVFVLHPHQHHIRVAGADAHTLPPGLPPRRAVLAANMQTALNVCGDAGVAQAMHVLVIGGGVLGLLVASAASKVALVTVTDIDPSRAPLAKAVGARFAAPENAPRDQHVVIHTSATEEGLRLALRCATTEGRIVEASWYGDKVVSLPLGEDFHARRLQIVSSQVGMLAPSLRDHTTHGKLLAQALRHLEDSALEALIGGEIPFNDAPSLLPENLRGPGLMTVLRY